MKPVGAKPVDAKTLHLTPAKLAERIAAALGRLQAIDVERHGLALAVEEGDPVAQARHQALEKERARLVSDLERLQAAKSQADARAAEATQAAIARDRERRAAEVRALAGACAAKVATLDRLTAEMTALLKSLGDAHAALHAMTGGIPPNGPLHGFVAALPARLRQALSASGIAGFGAPGLLDWSGVFADDYPGADYFAALLQPRDIGEIEPLARCETRRAG